MGVLLGNKKMIIIVPFQWMMILLVFSYILNFAESLWFRALGYSGVVATGQKFSAYLTSTIICLMCDHGVRNSISRKINKRVQKCLLKIGDYSFGIYLIHILLRDALRSICILSAGSETIIVLLFSCLIIYFSKRLVPEKITKYIGF